MKTITPEVAEWQGMHIDDVRELYSNMPPSAQKARLGAYLDSVNSRPATTAQATPVAPVENAPSAMRTAPPPAIMKGAPKAAPLPALVQGPPIAGGLDARRMALLDAIAGKESRGRYDIGFGGTKISDMSWHPGQSLSRRIERGPNAGKTSSAAGRYQFMAKDWNEWAKRAGVTDFSPASQDKAAWELASYQYARNTGRSLDEDIKSDDPKIIGNIGRQLSGRWTSLPGGIEQTMDEPEFAKRFQASLGGTPMVENSALGQPAIMQGAPGRALPPGTPNGPLQVGPPNAPPVMGPVNQAEPYSRQGPMPQLPTIPGVQQESPEMQKKRLENVYEIWKKQQEQLRREQLPPGYGDMSHMKAGLAGLSNPGYQDMSEFGQSGLMNLMQMLRMGGSNGGR